MKERPIIFNAEMVRAILDGRKTQTRRIIKPQPTLSNTSGFNWKGAAYGLGFNDKETNRNFAHTNACPLGRVGDRLWVRETFSTLAAGSFEQEKPKQATCQDIRYFASEKLATADKDVRGYGWIPSIHMPRWASRINLEITGVRVERLKDINEEDAIAEGCDYPEVDGMGWKFKADFNFRFLWKKIYGEDSLNANPWVWVIEFKQGGAA